MEEAVQMAVRDTVVSQKVVNHAKVVPSSDPNITFSDEQGHMDPEYAVNDIYGEDSLLLDQEVDTEKPADVAVAWERFKDWVKAQQWPCSVNDKALIVRVYRWIMLFVLLGFGFASLYIYLDETTVNKDYTFSGDELTIDVSACRIWFKKGTESDVTVHVSSQTRASYFNSTQPDNEYFDVTDTTLKLHNPNEDVDAWDIELESASFPNLYIRCDEWQWPITQEDEDEELTFQGKLEIKHLGNEADGNVYFKRIDVGELDMNITGTLVIEQLTTAVGGTIISNDGDIWIQSQQESKVRWNTYASSAYQFVGPEAYHDTAPACDTANITMSNSTFEVNNCVGNSVVCLTPGCAGEFSLDLQATDGGIYVHLLESPGKLYSSKSVSWRDDDSLISHTVDLLSKIKIQNIRDELQGEVVQDQFFTITMAGVNYDIGRWLFTTKEAYTQLKPWWIQLISFGLLLPVPKHADLRLVPWPLVQSEPFDVDNLVLMGNIWNIIYGEFGSDPDQLLLWMDGSHDDEDNWYKYSQDKFNEYERELQQLSDNSPLLGALIMSGCLGLVGAIAGAIVAWWALKKYSRMFWKNLDHKKRYKRIQLVVGNRQEKYDPAFREEMAMKVDTKPAPGEGRFPPPFAVADIIVTTYQKANQGSLLEFLKVVVKKETEEQLSVPIYRVRDLKERYESFCFANDFSEQVIRKQKAVFLKFGFELKTQSDSTTEAFKNIRKKTEQEIREEPDVRQIPGEDSLSFFVRSKYTKTTFDNDIIFQTEFLRDYNDFCKRRGKVIKKIVPLTKRAMVTLGFDFERLTVNIVKSKDGKNRLDLQIADKLIYEPILEPMPTAWYFYDIMAIMVHCCWIGILLFPIVAALVFWQHLHYTMSTRPVDQFITLQDVRYRPWLILEKQENFELWTLIALGVNGVILLLSVIELLAYYTTRDIPFQLDKIIHQPNRCHAVTQSIFYVLIYFVAAICSGYAIIGICWCILGAVLNPEVFLPYAAAAATFVSFVVFKIKNAVDNWQSILRELQEILITRMNGMLHAMLDRVIGKIKFDGAKEIVGEVGTIGAALASGRYMHALQKSGLGDVLDSMGLHPELILAIANGDPAAIGMIAEQFGVDAVIVEALSAAVTQDLDALAEAIPKLSALPGIGIDPEVAKSFVMLAWNPNEVNLRTSVKTAVIQFTKVMNNKLDLGIPLDRLDEPSDPAGATYLNQSFVPAAGNVFAGMITGAAQPTPTPAQQAPPAQTSPAHTMVQQAATGAVQQLNINPRVIEALVDMAWEGDLTRLAEILFEFEEAEYLPKHTCKIFDFLKCLNSHDHEFIKTLLILLHAFCPNLSQPFTTGLGCLVSDKYHGYVQQTKVRDGKFDALWPEIDNLLKIVKLGDESIIVKVMMCLTRGSKNTLQRFIPSLVKYLNSRLGWKLKSKYVRSLFTMVNGVRLNIPKLASRWNVNAEAVRFFPSMMLCPFEKVHVLQHIGEPMANAFGSVFMNAARTGTTTGAMFPDRPSIRSNDIPTNPSDVLPQTPEPTAEVSKTVTGTDLLTLTPQPPAEETKTVTDADLLSLNDPEQPVEAEAEENAIRDSTLADPEQFEDEEEEKQEVKPPSEAVSRREEDITAIETPRDEVSEDEEPEDSMQVEDLAVNESGFEDTGDFKPGTLAPKKKSKSEESPSVRILKYSIRPDDRSMTWLAKKFKLGDNIVMGIFITIRRAYIEHNIYIEDLIKDVLRRVGIDSQSRTNIKVCSDIFKLIVSVDADTIKKAHGDLNLKFVELALIANHVMNPKDLPPNYLVEYLNFEENPDEVRLVKMAQKLDWDKKPVQCDNWCKAVSIEIGKKVKKAPSVGNAKDGEADKLQLLMARSLLMMTVRAPSLLIKKLLQINCAADDVQINDFRTLIQAHYIKKMEECSPMRETAISDLSRLYEIPQKPLQAFIDVSLAQSSKRRKDAMMILLDSFNYDEPYKSKIERVVYDAKHQLDTLKQNVDNFEALGELLGLPPQFIESLSPGIIKAMEKNRKIKKAFITKFAEEFGVKILKLRNAISAFVMNESSGVEYVGKVLGLEGQVLTRAVKLFGVSHPAESIEQIASFLPEKAYKVKNVVKAFSALIAGYVGRIDREIDPESKIRGSKTFLAPVILEQTLGISRYIFRGLMSSIKNQVNDVKYYIMKLCQRNLGKFLMDDAFCRGFLSISTGGIEGIEDICHVLPYSADYAEVLVMMSNHNDMTHSQILTNTQFANIWVKLGLKTHQMAAMLALTQQDIENNDEICEDLGPEKLFPRDMIKALMTVYKFNTVSGDIHDNYDPKYKKAMMIENIKPISSLVGVTDSKVASFIIGLVQGNAGVIEDIFQRFGWNGIERSAYGAFCCLFHPYPFKDDDNDTGLFDWIADKELGQVCACIGSLLKLDPEGVEKIVLLARDDPSTIQWLEYFLNMSGTTDAKNFLKVARNEGELLDEDEDIQEDQLEEGIDWALLNDEEYGKIEENKRPESKINEGVLQRQKTKKESSDAKSADSSVVSEAGEEFLKDKLVENKKNTGQLQIDFLGRMRELEYELNNLYRKGRQQFTVENIQFLIFLAAGKFSKIDQLQNILDETYRDKNPVDVLVIQELLAITSGDYKHVEYLLKEVLPKLDEEERASKSILMKLKLQPGQIEFLMKLACRDIKWLDMRDEKGQTISSKIIPNPKLARAVFALCSLEPTALQQYTPKLSKHLEMDVDMAQMLVLLSNQALNRAVLGIAPLAERLEVETNITNSFCCMAYSDLQLRMDAIKILADRLEIKNLQSVMAILTIIAGDFYVGWDLLTKLVYTPMITTGNQPVNSFANASVKGLSNPATKSAATVEPTVEESMTSKQRKQYKEDLEKYETKVKLFQHILQILARRWDSNLRQRTMQSSMTLKTKKTLQAGLPQGLDEKDTTALNAAPVGAKNEFLVERNMVFGTNQIDARNMIGQGLGFSDAALVDYIIAIAQNQQSIVAPTMTRLLRLNIGVKQVKLIEALLHLYNGNDSEIPYATDYIENYISENPYFAEDKRIPEGLLQAIYGSVREFNETMIKGIERGLKSAANDWGQKMKPKMYQFVPLFMVYSGQPKSCLKYMSKQDFKKAAQAIIGQLLGMPKPSKLHCGIFQSLISSNVAKFMSTVYSDLNRTHGLDAKELVKEVQDLATPGKTLPSLPYITKIIMDQFDLKKEFTQAMILVISNTHDAKQIEESLVGMDDKLRCIIKFFVNELKGQIGINSKLAAQLFELINDEPAIMKILDACYLAFKDPQANTKQVLEILPTVAKSLLGDQIPNKAIKLITGIIKLFKAGEDDEKLKQESIIDLAGSFDIDQHLVKGFLALAKGDWRAMKQMIARICEFDEGLIDKIVQLILQLRKAKAADTTEEKTEQTTDKYEQLKQRIPDGTDVEAVFDMLDVSSDGTLHFNEFQEAFKIYNLPMSEERQLEIFTRFDTDGGDNELSLQNFVQCMAYIRKEVSRQAMDDLGFSIGANIGKILIAIIILLILFVFIFLGIAGFTTNTTLGSVVNSLMPISAGGLLTRAGSTDLTEVIKKIKDSVEQRLSVLTMSDV